MRFRFAPSPTGTLHLGTAMTAVANVAAARSSGGTLLLRIDDTDAERSTLDHEAHLLAMLAWLGVTWQGSPIRQSERADRHQAAIEYLLGECRAYHCFCSEARLTELRETQQAANQPPRYDRLCRTMSGDEAMARVAAGDASSIRLMVDDADVTFADLVRGDITIPAGSFGDFVIRRSDETPTYQLATVVDDADMAITRVLQAEDHLANTARQILVSIALDRVPPEYGHLPLVRNADGSKLSKRSNMGSVERLRDEGVDPAAIRMYAMELLGVGVIDPLDEPQNGGWFNVDRISTSAPKVSHERLDSIARQRMADDGAEIDIEMIVAALSGAGVSSNAAHIEPLVDDIRAETAGQEALQQAVIDLLAEAGDIEGEAPAVACELIAEHGLDELSCAREVMQGLKRAAKKRGEPVGATLRPVRRALTAADRGPSLAAVMYALGTDESLRRLSP